MEVDEAVLGRPLVDRCSSLSLRGADGLSGDGEDGRESDVPRGIVTELVGDVVKLPESSLEAYEGALMTKCGRGGVSKESIRTVPIT